jgi:hypothetical protein
MYTRKTLGEHEEVVKRGKQGVGSSREGGARRVEHREVSTER